MVKVTRRHVSARVAPETRPDLTDDPANHGMWLGGHYRLTDGIVRDYCCRWCSPRRRVRLEWHYEPDKQHFVMRCAQGLHEIACWADVRHYGQIDYLIEQAQIEESIARELYPRWRDTMPIARIDRQTDEAPGLYEIGRIRKGEEKPADGKRPGKDLDYFRIDMNDGEPQEVADFLREKWGTDEPRDIRVMLPFDTLNAVWVYWLEVYVAGGLMHRCDGEYVDFERNAKTRAVTVKDGVSQDGGGRVECDGSRHFVEKEKDGKTVRVEVAKPHSRLRIILPELGRAVAFTFVTSSWYDITEITANLKTFNRMFGTLAGLPIVLKRRPRMISAPIGEGGRPVRLEKNLVYLELDPDFVARQFALLADKQDKAELLLEAGNGGEHPEPKGKGHLYSDPDFKGFDTPGKAPDKLEAEEGEIGGDKLGQGIPNGYAPDYPGPGSLVEFFDSFKTVGDKIGPDDEEYEDFKAGEHGLLDDEPKVESLADSAPEGDGKPARPSYTSRPWLPEQLKHIIEIKVAKHPAAPTVPASDGQRGLLAGKGEELFAGDEDADKKRHSLFDYLVGRTSARELTKAEAHVLIDWMLEEKDSDTGDYPFKPHAVAEARAVIRQVMLDAGQQELPIEETEKASDDTD